MCQAKYMEWLIAHTLWQAAACASHAGEIVHAGRYSIPVKLQALPPTSHARRRYKAIGPQRDAREGRRGRSLF